MITASIVGRKTIEKSITDSEFRGWLDNAAAGAALEYHRGYLARDIVAHTSRLSEHDRMELSRLARCVWWATEQNLIHLIQRRYGPCDYGYLAIARSKPTKALASLRSLLLEEVA